MNDELEPKDELQPVDEQECDDRMEVQRMGLASRVINVFLGLMALGFIVGMVGETTHRFSYDPPGWFRDLMLAALSSSLSVLGLEMSWHVINRKKKDD